jgi:hypothetical protein
MSMLHKFEPRKRVVDVERSTPLTHSMEEFFKDSPSRRWMEAFHRQELGYGKLLCAVVLPKVQAAARHTVKVA